MSKNKAVDVRSKKRKHQADSELLSHSNVDDLPKQSVGQKSALQEGFRFSKLKNKNTVCLFSCDRVFGFKVPKHMFLFPLSIIILVILGIVFNQFFCWYKAKLIVTPNSLAKVIFRDTGDRSHDLFWGTYRPGVYFGIRHRTPRSLLFGVIWAVKNSNNIVFRHDCDSNDGVLSYNWLEHDGRNFGTQQIVDIHHIITISFVKQPVDHLGGDWTVRISAVNRNPNEPAYPITAMIYFYYPGEEHSYYISPLGKNSELFGFQGSTLELDDFFIHMHPASNANQGRLFTGVVPREDKIMETVYSVFGLGKGDGKSNSPTMDKDTNIWIYELSTNFSSPNIKSDNILLEVEFTRFQTAAKSFSGDEFTKELNNQRNMFHQQFAKKFKINLNKFTERQVNLSKIAVSNLLGGIGYFYGSSLVRSGSIQDTKPVSNWPAGLFTATPSRSMFPRGFLWDEGFHGLITSRWDPRLAMETVGHWLDLLNVNGWIPREQILGFESRSRVPDEFVVQTDGIANPPSLILVIESILDNLPKLTALERIEFRSWSIVVLPRLHVWYQWFNTTQKGPLPLTYRWRGRNSKEIHQLNPLTLSSGLDDYPRASHPSDDERHLDLRCWMTLFARIITKLASVVAQTMQTDLGSQGIVQSQLDETRSLIAHYKYWADCLSDQSELDKLHWSDKFQRYADYGLHTDSVRMQVLPDVNKHIPNDDVEQIRVADQNPSLKLVTSSFGYVNLFPLLFRMIAPNSNRLPILLSDLGNPDLLWTNYGIRSLDPQSLFYKKSNTIHDPPYWRGPIWINLNYIIVKSLKYYANHPRTPSDIAQTASNLGDQLGHNLVRTVLGELERTGFLWEQYNDETGRGQRGHPFSGWTSLISLIISDIP